MTSEPRVGEAGDGCRYVILRIDGRPLVLLHGYSFTHEVWEEIGLLKRLAEEEIPYLAPDMPYGAKTSCRTKSRAREDNINFLRGLYRQKFGDRVPIVLGASLGGYMALLYGMMYPVAGLILVAPVWSTRGDILGYYSEREIPILLIYGEKDDIVSIDEMWEFKEMVPTAELRVYEDARHPAYLDKPERFNEDVVEFCKKV